MSNTFHPMRGSTSYTSPFTVPALLLVLFLLASHQAPATSATETSSAGVADNHRHLVVRNQLLTAEEEALLQEQAAHLGGGIDGVLGELSEDGNEFTPPLVLQLQDDQEQRLDGEQRLDDDRDKRAPSGFVGMRGKKAPMGFLGMRGRRGDDVDIDQYSEWSDQALADDPMEEEKRGRAPYGFVGMRGKKAASGFMGMRGKKVPSGFLGLRGKKIPQNLHDLIQALSTRYRGNSLGYKRAPLGFVGLRGRRTDPTIPHTDGAAYSAGFPLQDGELNKRAPMGFMGMRG